MVARQARRRNARILERFPDHFQQQALLWVHLLCFTRGNAEGQGVEPQGIIEITAREGIGEAGRRRARTQEALHAPTTGWCRFHRVAAVT